MLLRPKQVALKCTDTKRDSSHTNRND